MFNLFKKNKKNEDLTETVSAISQFLVSDEGSGFPTPYKEFLDSTKLDYSLESLGYVEFYLDEIRKKQKELNDEQFTKIILRCGSYLGEVLRRNFNKNSYWINYDTAISIDPAIKNYAKSAPVSYILFTEPNTFTFPLAKIVKIIEETQKDGLSSFVLVLKN